MEGAVALAVAALPVVDMQLERSQRAMGPLDFPVILALELPMRDSTR